MYVQGLASQVDELVRCTIQRRSVVRTKRIARIAATAATKEQTELYLGRLIELISQFSA
jgi:hypothetical protein